jgi:plastocyanin
MVIVFYSSCTPIDDTPTFGYETFMGPSEEEMVLKRALSNQGPGVYKIDIKGMTFEPKEVRVNIGDTLLWVNKDFYAHDVTEFKTKKWNSPKLEPGTAWAMIVKEEAEYFCSIHVVMKGKIEIKANL